MLLLCLLIYGPFDCCDEKQDYTNGKLFDRSVLNEDAPESEQRLQKVVLVYRRYGKYDSPWVEAQLEDPDINTRESTPAMIEFANDGVEVGCYMSKFKQMDYFLKTYIQYRMTWAMRLSSGMWPAFLIQDTSSKW